MSIFTRTPNRHLIPEIVIELRPHVQVEDFEAEELFGIVIPPTVSAKASAAHRVTLEPEDAT